MTLLTLDTHWTAFYDQKPTFYWILHEYQQEICNPAEKRGWKAESTLAYYSRLYNEYILPRIDHQALEDFTSLDIQSIVLNICDSRVARGVECNEETVNRIWRAIKRVCQTAANHGICDDVLWAPPITPDEPVYEAEEKEQLKLPKHLSPEQEHAINEALLSDPLQAGVRNGLMLMYVFGLRNSEACGATFGSILTFGSQHYLATHKTTDENEHIYLGGGKTINMYRLLWIPPRVYRFLMTLKKHVISKIENGEITFHPQSVIQSIDDLPIARNKDNWLEPCISAQLTSAGRQLFSEIHYNEQAYRLALLHVLNLNDEEKIIYGDTKDPTAYIFRRNFATHLRDCGATLEQLQYAMGHQIVDDAFRRVDFVNPDLRCELAHILSYRPIINDISSVIIIPAMNGTILDDLSTAKLSIPLTGKHYRIHVVGYESYEPIKVDISGPANVSGLVIQHRQIPRPQSKAERDAVVRNANVLHDYHRLYFRKKQ